MEIRHIDRIRGCGRESKSVKLQFAPSRGLRTEDYSKENYSRENYSKRNCNK